MRASEMPQAYRAGRDHRCSIPFDVGKCRAGRRWRKFPDSRRADRLEVAPAVAAIGLQVIAFRPLVPRIDEQQSLVAAMPQPRLGDRMAEPDAEKLRARVDDDHSFVLSSRSVVPHRRHAAKLAIRRSRQHKVVRRQTGVAEDRAPERRVRDIDPVDSILGGMTERRKLDRGVEAVRRRIVERISLHGGEVELAGPFAPGGFTP